MERPPAPAATLTQVGLSSPSSLEQQGEQTTHNLPLIAAVFGIILLVSITVGLAGWACRLHQRHRRFAEEKPSRRGSAKSTADQAEKGEIEVQSEVGHAQAQTTTGTTGTKVEPAVQVESETAHVEVAADVQAKVETVAPADAPGVMVPKVEPTKVAGPEVDGEQATEDQRKSGGHVV